RLADRRVEVTPVLPVLEQQREAAVRVERRELRHGAIAERISGLRGGRSLLEALLELLERRRAAQRERDVRREHVVAPPLARRDGRIALIEPPGRTVAESLVQCEMRQLVPQRFLR